MTFFSFAMLSPFFNFGNVIWSACARLSDSREGRSRKQAAQKIRLARSAGEGGGGRKKKIPSRSDSHIKYFFLEPGTANQLVRKAHRDHELLSSQSLSSVCAS